MPIQVQVDDELLEFPDDMSDDDIQSVLRKEFPSTQETPALSESDSLKVSEQLKSQDQFQQNLRAYTGGSFMSPGGPDMDFARALYQDVPAKIGEGLHAVMKPIEAVAAPVLDVLRAATVPTTYGMTGEVTPQIQPGKTVLHGLEPPPDARGIIPSVRRAAAGMTTPGSLAVLPLAAGETIPAKIIQGAFAAGAGASVPGALKELSEAKTPAEKRGAITDATLSLLFAGMMGRQAAKPNTRAETISALRKALESEPQLPIRTAQVAPALRELGIPQAELTGEPFLKPEVRQLASDALREAQARIIEPGQEGVAANALRQAIEPTQLTQGEPTRLAERVEGGGEAPYGKVSYQRTAEAPTASRTQRVTAQEKEILQSIIDEEAAKGAEFEQRNLPEGLTYRRPKEAPTREEYERQRRREDVESGLVDESGQYLDEPTRGMLPEVPPAAERARGGVAIIEPGTGRAIEKPIPLSALQRSRLRAALSRGASEQAIKNILRLEAPKNPQAVKPAPPVREMRPIEPGRGEEINAPGVEDVRAQRALEARQAATEKPPTANEILDKPHGSTAPESIAALPDAEFNNLVDGSKGRKYSLTADATAWAMNQNATPELIARLKNLRESETAANRKALADQNWYRRDRSQWYSDALHVLEGSEVGRGNVAEISSLAERGIIKIVEPAPKAKAADPVEQWFDEAIERVKFGTDWTSKTSMGLAQIPVWLTREAATLALQAAKGVYRIAKHSLPAIQAGLDALRNLKGFNEAEATKWLKSQLDSEPTGTLKSSSEIAGERFPKTEPTKEATAPKAEIAAKPPVISAATIEVKDPITGEPAKLITEKAARAMESKVKIPAEADVKKLADQMNLFSKEIGDALETGGQFLAKDLRPDVAKGAPAERGTVTSKDINQYFVNKLSSIRKDMQATKQKIQLQADVESGVYFDLLQKRFEQAFRQVQELRRASHESLYFWNKIKAEYQDIARAAGEMPEMKRQLPVLDQIWKDMREKKYPQAGKHFVDYLRMNLFTMGSWTLDFGTNLIATGTKLPAWAIMDMAAMATGRAPTRMFSAMRSLSDNMKNWNPLGKRFRLPEQIESELGMTAGGEFGGRGREVMVDFSEILKDRPELADKLRHIDKVIGAPVRMKRAVDGFFGRFGATAELYNRAYMEGKTRGMKGDELKTFVEEFVINPPEGAVSRAVKTGKELKFNRDLTKWEEAYAGNIVTKLVVEAFPRWTLQFIRWGGEMVGANPVFFRDLVTGKATPEQAVNYLTKAATGWGGIYAFNQLFYDNIDANSMEYVKEDGNRVRLAGRTPAPELFFIVALLRGESEKAKAALAHLSVPGAKLLSGEPAGLISPLVDTIRESIRGRYTMEQTARELTKLVNDTIPGKSVLGLIRALYDPSIREGIGSPIPGAASRLPQRINPTTGEPLAPKTRIPGTKIELPSVGGTPFPGAERVLNDIEKALLNHGLGNTRPRRTSIIDLPAEDVPKDVRREYEKLVGQNVKEFIGAEIQEPDFKELPFEVRREVLQQLLTNARTIARADIAEKYGASGESVQSTPLNIQRMPERLRQ